MNYINQLEPKALIDDFLANPPQDFSVGLYANCVPFFTAKFDLLTTADDNFKHKIQKIPFFHKWSGYLKPKTCFIGTTVSEYALLSNALTGQQLADGLKQTVCKNYAFTIVKDLPSLSPLLAKQDNSYSVELINALKDKGFIEVEGQALAYVPIDFTDIEHVFAQFSASRRKNFRRKLKAKQQLTIDVVQSGDACFFNEQLLDEYYQLYLNVYEQSEIHFDRLSKVFFKQLLQSQSAQAHIFTYHHNNELIGYNICFVKNNMLIDKYIGLVYPKARELNLYYVSWFHNLEYARQQGFSHYIAGWTDPEVKAQLGAKFTFTKHLVYIRNPILRGILAKFIGHFESDKEKII